MASIDRTAYPRFSHPLSDQELDARYGPTDEETALTLEKSLGAGARLTFLVMLKSRQQLGYFPLLDEVPKQIVGFLRDALDFPAFTALLDARVKTKTLFRYRDLIRAYRITVTPYHLHYFRLGLRCEGGKAQLKRAATIEITQQVARPDRMRRTSLNVISADPSSQGRTGIRTAVLQAPKPHRERATGTAAEAQTIRENQFSRPMIRFT